MSSTTSDRHETRTPAFVSSYGTPAIAFHWAMAILIAFLGVEGYLIDSMPRASREWWISLHVGVGAIVAFLLVGRIAWRATHRPPELPAQTHSLIRIAANAVHMLIYATMLFVMLAGFVNIFSRGHGIDFGIFQVPPIMTADRTVARPFDRMHAYSAYFLLALAGTHMLAALWHHFIARDTVLLRMWPTRHGRTAITDLPAPEL